MCFGQGASPEVALDDAGSKVAYHISQLNDSTHLIVHNDNLYEYPFIYVKLYPSLQLAVVIDTGCGAQNGKEGSSAQELRDFIQTTILRDSSEGNQNVDYHFLVICSHCHFDHIGGIEAFTKSGATIVASNYDEHFNTPENRDASSLCSAFGLPLPQYTISKHVAGNERLTYNGHDLGIKILHTPGHTPDSMAIYDENEHWLFVGDTCYQRRAKLPWGEDVSVPIIIPPQGDWEAFQQSVKKMNVFVREEEAKLDDGVFVRLGAGHTTSSGKAIEFLDEVQAFIDQLLRGGKLILERFPNGEIVPGGTLGDEPFTYFQEGGDAMFGLIAPDRLMGDIPSRCQPWT